jgi:catechol 2,3-dioxygenase-like lactoylglutathione lyase family enzyme
MSAVDAGRRRTIALLAVSCLPLTRAYAGEQALLPLDTPGLDHLDVIVPDVEKSARFYMGLFRTTLHAQPYQGAQRYFVLLGPLPENRAVGYLAIGAARGRAPAIGHFCTSVSNWRRDSATVFAQMTEQFAAAGLGTFPGANGVGGIFNDPDGIEIQFLPAPDTLVTAAVPSDLVPGMQGLVVPQRVDHTLLHVSDLAVALKYYRILYGRETTRTEKQAAFRFRNGSTLTLQQAAYRYGEAKPRIARFGIRVQAFDRAAVEAGIVALGGSVVGHEGKALRLRDVDGIELDLVTA